MKVCPNCKADLPEDSSTTCMYCGHDVKIDDDTPDDNSNRYESPNQIIPEQSTISLDDDLSLESTSDIMEQEAINQTGKLNIQPEEGHRNNQVIGDTSSPLPPPPGENTQDINTIDKDGALNSTKNNVKVLSEDEIKDIEKNLYGSSSYLSEKEKSDLLGKMENNNHDHARAESPKKELPEQNIPKQSEPVQVDIQNFPSHLPTPKIAKRNKGVAYFYKNYIQIKGNYQLKNNDEFMINDREYVLKPKNLNPKLVIGAIVGVLLIAIIGSGIVFLTGSPNGYGQIAGVVLDKNNHPFIKGATVQLTEIGQKVISDGQGFFRFKDVPPGAQKIEYIINDQVVKVDYATVSNGKISFMLLQPDPALLAGKPKSNPQPPKQPSAEVAKPQPVASNTPKADTEKKEPAKNSAPQKSTSNFAKITLNANVQGAKLEIDGQVMGAGNLTYPKIKTGNHSYSVSADGYQKAIGSLTLQPDENKTLSVNLKPIETAEKNATFKTKDYLYSGETAFKNGDYNTAVNDLTEAVKTEPGLADAYYIRGQAYAKLNKNDIATEDLIKAAEIYQFAKNFNKAISSYNMAIENDNESISAYLGRGKLYLKKGEPVAAIADFDKVTNLDRRNFDAYFGLGEASFKQRRYKTAVKNFNDARSIDKDNQLVYQYLMLSYMAIDDFKNVKKVFERFTEVATDEQIEKFKSDQRHAAIVKVIELH